MAVEFEEEGISSHIPSSIQNTQHFVAPQFVQKPKGSKFSRLLVQVRMVENEEQAVYILLGIAAIFLIIAIIVIYITFFHQQHLVPVEVSLL